MKLAMDLYNIADEKIEQCCDYSVLLSEVNKIRSSYNSADIIYLLAIVETLYAKNINLFDWLQQTIWDNDIFFGKEDLGNFWSYINRLQEEQTKLRSINSLLSQLRSEQLKDCAPIYNRNINKVIQILSENDYKDRLFYYSYFDSVQNVEIQEILRYKHCDYNENTYFGFKSALKSYSKKFFDAFCFKEFCFSRFSSEDYTKLLENSRVQLLAKALQFSESFLVAACISKPSVYEGALINDDQKIDADDLSKSFDIVIDSCSKGIIKKDLNILFERVLNEILRIDAALVSDDEIDSIRNMYVNNKGRKAFYGYDNLC